MHDPMVVAFQICRPWPRWTRDKRRRLYWPAIVRVWHVEPGGHDSGEVCKQFRRDKTGKVVVTRGWYLHVHHWRIQVPPLQALRRRLLTRCEWCGGRDRRRDPVNHSTGGSRRRPWWRGEAGLKHSDCASVSRAHQTCCCAVPFTEHDGYGRCFNCDRFRPFGASARRLEIAAILSAIPAGTRDKAAYDKAVAAQPTTEVER